MDVIPEPVKGYAELVGRLKPKTLLNYEAIAKDVVDGRDIKAAYRNRFKCKEISARSGASKLKKDTVFKELVTRYKALKFKALDVDSNYVISKLKDIVESTSDPKSKTYNPAAAVNALKLLGQHCGTFENVNKNNEIRPSFVGITINTGDATAKLLKTKGNGGTKGLG